MTIQIGWMNWRFSEKRYVQVKNTAQNPDVAIKAIRINPDLGYEETLKILCEAFFPLGRSCKGKLSAFNCALGNSKGKPLSKDKFLIKEWLKEVSTQKPRLYLLLRRKV